MKSQPFYLLFSLVVMLISAQVTMVHAEAVKQPVITQPGKISNPTKVSNAAKTNQVKKQSPNRKMQVGYCLVNNEIIELDKKTCARKRGKFFTDQRSAGNALDAQQGFCCKDGEMTRSTRKSCTRTKGAFFLRQNEASQECAATKGYCCAAGAVTASSKGDCDRKKGDFYIQKQDAVNLCAKQEGYCCQDGNVSETTQGDCEKLRGFFSMRQHEAENNCARQNGYCCTDGKVTRINKGRCDQVKGTFSVRQIDARHACDNERGYCCTDGKIINASRKVCDQKNGHFASSRAELVQSCKPLKAPRTAANTPSKRIATTTPPLQQAKNSTGLKKSVPQTVSQNITPQGYDDPLFIEKQNPRPQGFDDPLFVEKQNTRPQGYDDPLFVEKQNTRPQGYDDPLFVEKSQRIKPKINSTLQQTKKTPRIAPEPPTYHGQSSGNQVVLSSGQAAGQIVGLNNQNIQAASPENTLEFREPEVSVSAEFEGNNYSYWYVSGVNGDKFFWEIGGVDHAVPRAGIDATLKGTISCGTGTLEKADIFVLGGNVFYDVHEQLNTQGQFTLNDVTLAYREQIRDEMCPDGTLYFDRDKNLDVVVEYTCKDLAGTSRILQSEKIPIRIKFTCDRRVVGNRAEKSIYRYRHTCPPGYQLEGYGGHTTTITSRDWNNPLPCVKIN